MDSTPAHMDLSDTLARARRVLKLEAEGLDALSAALDESFVRAIEILEKVEGRIIVTGMGKSGHIAHKIAATLASTGKPAMFIHPGEASHGDLGMIGEKDAILAYTNSGSTAELGDIVAYSRRFKLPLVLITSNAAGEFVEQADVTLVLPAAEEACFIGMAPTTSTTLMMALGDALAVVLMERVGFTMDDYKQRHPGGQLGRRLLKVSDLMHAGDSMPVAGPDQTMADVLPEMTAKSLGCVGIVGADGKLAGIVTDGDLRRHMGDDLLRRKVVDIMSKNPRTIRPTALASEAVAVMNEMKITALFVAEKGGRAVGLIHIHDCLRAGVV
jgi:arabinose-5-phosphate isomerase